MLNERLEFSDLREDWQAGFKGYGTKAKLEARTPLFRFSQTDQTSPWWSELKDLPGILAAAQKSSEPFPTYIRKRTAVFKHWNVQRYLIVAELTEPVWGFRGVIAPQAITNIHDQKTSRLPIVAKRYTKPVFWGGGFNQVLIPNIEPHHYRLIVMEGVIEINDPVGDIADALISFGLI